ncbi:MAG: dipeptide ABC transporter ATP-binding protein [Angelakisella sp.]|jgi:oligopeptide/dipeptide ABC transporter ATP-binding protein|nr:dipeptide ABC transporter ATP-binding protein [Angelakisella sp.]
MSDALLEVQNLKLYYPVKVRQNILRSETRYVKAVDDISFTVNKGETFGLVGESGCGKSTTGKTIVKLLRPTAGDILFEGKSIFARQEEGQDLTTRIQIIFQDPYSSLDPRFTVGRCIAEPMVVHKTGTPQQREERVRQLMKDVGLRPEHYTKYPHEFSGGQRQRIGVARALALNPSLIVCDEPVSALDVSIQAQILNLMQDLQKKYDLTYIFISHNLSVVKHLCDRIAVMYLGNMVEIASKNDLFDRPAHPYTQALLDAIPIPDPDIPTMQEMLEGDVPSPMDPPAGCCFHTRCKKACPRCAQERPRLREIAPGHLVACHF